MTRRTLPNPSTPHAPIVGRAAVLLAVAAAWVMSACTTDAGNVGLLIVQAQIPTTSASASTSACTIPGMLTSQRRDMGTLDVALGNYPYTLYPLVANQLSTLGDPTLGGPEPNNIMVTSLSVEIQPPPGAKFVTTKSCPAAYNSPTNATTLLHPGDTASTSVDVILPCISEQLRAMFQSGLLPSGLDQQVVFHSIVRAHGNHGSSTIESAAFQFPIRVCYGCMQTGFSMDGFTSFNFPFVPKCKDLAKNPYQGNPCNPGQDPDGFGPVLCCATDETGKQIQCPGQPTGSAAATAKQ